MTQLYFIFFLIGGLIFAAIVFYSLRQQKRSLKRKQSDYVDPLFAELESKKAESTKVERTFDAQVQTDSSSASDNKESAPGSKAETELTAKKQSHVNGDNKANDHVRKKTEAGTQANTTQTNTTQANEGDKNQQVSASTGAGEKPHRDKAEVIVTELVARVKNTTPIEQQQLLSVFRKHDFKFHRAVHIYGLNELTDLWRDIEFELPSARFVELGIAIQLADREGAMAQKELHDFQQMVLEFTNEFDAPFEFSLDIDQAQKQAYLLDEIGRRYDSMAVLNVVPRSKSGFRMADIESCARDLGMSADKNGIFLKAKGNRQNLSVHYRLACTDGSGQFGLTDSTMVPIHDLVMYMNVPATEDPEIVFQEIVKDTNSLATWLDGKVVDRNGRAMTQRSYSVLTQQISDIVYSMQQDGLTPGDEVSKKIF